ncbi:MAG: hypothetical protein LQ348_006789 [Seirophora lacunosa]|nr:MAG: hypothetical protein LQ344_004416 [Seirophora lacunosa]KAI4172393.1 MAG: hypothetical protein LQ348_006789 [Seirophora lacunosa]
MTTSSLKPTELLMETTNPPVDFPAPPPPATPAAATAASAVSLALNDGKKHLLLAASGSVATIKLPLILSSLSTHPNLSIRLILTRAATHFLAGQSPSQPPLSHLLALPNLDGLYHDADEWAAPWTRDAKILHIELRRWAHLLVIAPMSANLLAKVTAGLCDDLLTNVVRAWDVTRGIVAAPAMNQLMWEHPVTAKQMRVLREEWAWVEVVGPQVKALACGDLGMGGMCEWEELVEVVVRRLERLEVNVG